MAEFFPVLCGIHVEKRNAQPVVQSPTKCQWPGLARNQFRDQRAVPGDLDVEGYVRLALHVDYFRTVFGLYPTQRCLIRPLGIEVLDVDVRDGRTDIGKSPGDSLVVAYDHERHPRQSYSGHIKIGAAQMRLIPKVWHLVFQMHIV